ncbi:MAG: hypothetical protein AVDCRST_MAG39-619 [uncultured Sphingomonadaceae bacterium]|uniref:Uncharacterized protein n=1 Tax=uncultured Sphingomonadaceae bacterium TaxID=169976 RepID=A0A6J4S397_9SPHN|nr:MAG: hypothetical protein AVDCRST_MAG39-619 [uncultured Sphingomonadaceae bacterium]
MEAVLRESGSSLRWDDALQGEGLVRRAVSR